MMDFKNEKDLNKEKWVVEYSSQQDCFNITTLDNALEINIRNAYKKTNNDFQMLFIGSYEQCTMFIRNFKEVYWSE